MRTGLLIIVILIFSKDVYSQAVELKPVNVLIFSPDAKNKKYQEQIIMLGQDPLGLDKRNISILEIFPGGGLEADGSMMEASRAKKLRMDYGIQITDFRIVLIVNDSIPKLNQGETIDNGRLFKIIDDGFNRNVKN